MATTKFRSGSRPCICRPWGWLKERARKSDRGGTDDRGPGSICGVAEATGDFNRTKNGRNNFPVFLKYCIQPQPIELTFRTSAVDYLRLPPPGPEDGG